MEINLRKYQITAYDEIRASYRQGNKRVLFVLPTGGGKTYTFTYAAKMALDKGKTVFFLVHKKGLVSQISKSLSDFGIRHGFIAGNKPKQHYLKAQVCSVQSLINRLNDPTLPVPDLIIIDEAHHSNAGSWRKILDHYQDRHVLGVTATPIRTDGQGLGDVFQDMVLGPQIMDLIKSGSLVMPTVYRPKFEGDLSGVKIKSDGDYNEQQLVTVIDKPTITGDAIQKYRELCSGTPAVYFCINIEHCKHVSEQFRQAGYTSEAVYGTLEDSEIKRILSGLGSGAIQVVTSCDLISEGTDIPKIGCIGHLRPTQSLGLYMQMNGRGLRPCEGKDSCIIIDHVDNYKRHGHPCEDRNWTLEGMKKKGKKKEAEAAPDKYDFCGNCAAVIEAAPICPHCGAVIPKKEAREILQVDGELEKVVFEAEAARKKAEKLAEAERKKSERIEAELERKAIFKDNRKQEGMCRNFEDFFNLAKERGYKYPQQWAKHRANTMQKRK
jgi:superfamily II DNA or RNA helicase